MYTKQDTAQYYVVGSPHHQQRIICKKQTENMAKKILLDNGIPETNGVIEQKRLYSSWSRTFFKFFPK